MSVLSMFLHQTATWQKKVPDSENEFGEPQWGPPVSIRVRAVRQSKAHPDAMGNVVVTDFMVWCEQPVEVDDKLTVNDKPMIVTAHELHELRWLQGQYIGRVVHTVLMAS
jgi:hypothetical protein